MPGCGTSTVSRSGWARCGASSPALSPTKKTAHAAEQGRADVKAAREAWFEGQPDLDPTCLVFLDETWTSTNMAVCAGARPAAGGCARPYRMAIGRPRPSWRPCACPRSLRRSCWTGPVRRETFQAYVERVLVSELTPGDIVVMDNLAATSGWPYARPSKPRARGCFSSRPTRPTSIRSRWPFPSSRCCCAKPPSAPSRGCGRPSGGSSTPSPPTNATTSPPPRDMN